MKFSSSSPPPPTPPSSSGGSLSLDSKIAVSGCFAGILHRILCSRSLPTHPSDQITESCSVVSCDRQSEEAKQRNLIDKVVEPSLVARLMGLESMPNTSPVGTPTLPNSITRSLSMNSLECKGSLDRMQGGHRRVKSSTLSVLEMPAFLELEDEDFWVLSFENGSEETKRKSSSSSSRRKKSDTSTSLPLKDSCEKQVNPGFENVECSTPVKNKEEPKSETAKIRKKKKKKKKCVENDCSSEDSSPVSVLDFDQFMADHEVPRSELDSSLVGLNSRRKLSPEPGEFEAKNRIRRDDSSLMISEDTQTRKSEGKCVGSRKRGSCQSQSYLEETWDQICKMIEAEIAGSKWCLCSRREISNSISKRHQDFELICADFELQIVDQSLDELVQQLVGLNINL